MTDFGPGPSPTVVGGVSGSVQFNNSNILGGSANLVWDNVNNKLSLNKASSGNTNSVLFKDGLSSRGEIGLVANDNMHFRTSVDGSTFVDSIILDNTSGSVDLFEVESTVASASTTDIGSVTTMKVAISGTTTITSLGTKHHAVRILRFTGILTLTYNATSLILPGSANITTAVGDCAIATSDATGNWRIREYMRASGKALIGPAAADITDATATGIALLTAANAAAGRTTLTAAASGANADITNLTALAATVINTQGYSSCSGGSVTLSNNTAIGIALPNSLSMIVILCGSASIAPKGLWYARPGTPTMTSVVMVADAAVDTTTGILTGTTGTVGHVTVSAATNGNLYFENRSGASRSFTYTVIGTA